jgi:hypothetical protein
VMVKLLGVQKRTFRVAFAKDWVSGWVVVGKHLSVGGRGAGMMTTVLS